MLAIEIMPFQKMKPIYGEEVKITHKCLLCKLIVEDVCFTRRQQFVCPYCFLLLLSMVRFGENLRVCKSGCCANEQENVNLVFNMVTILFGILGIVVVVHIW